MTPIDGGEIDVFCVDTADVIVVVMTVVDVKLRLLDAVGDFTVHGFTSTTFGSTAVLAG